MQIAIADSDIKTVKIIRQVLSKVPDYNVIWEANDGIEAVKRSLKERPDVILLDVDVCGIGGVETTKRIMESSPCVVLMIDSPTECNTSKVFSAMGYGAVDAVDRPIQGDGEQIIGHEKLISKIKIVA